MTIYLGSRDLNGVPIGTHQFIVLTGFYLMSCRAFSAVEAQARFLGRKDGQDVYGVVVGAQNINGRLVAEYFEKSDLKATMEFFGGEAVSAFRSDFDTEMFEAGFGSLSDTAAIERVIWRIENYRINVRNDPIKYPTAGLGFNSNSWAQTVIQCSGGSATENTAGLDWASNKRIPETYFEPYCTARPKVN